MDEVRVGRILRALRKRLGWRQQDLAARVGVHRGTISLIERGHWRHLSFDTMQRLFGMLDARAELDVRWRGGAADRLIDERHARLVAGATTLLRGWGWSVDPEVTFSIFGERGSIDVLAYREVERLVGVGEVKGVILSAEETMRRHDVKVRLAQQVAEERLRWRPRAIARLLIVPESTAAAVSRAARSRVRARIPAPGLGLAPSVGRAGRRIRHPDDPRRPSRSLATGRCPRLRMGVARCDGCGRLRR